MPPPRQHAEHDSYAPFFSHFQDADLRRLGASRCCRKSTQKAGDFCRNEFDSRGERPKFLMSA